MLRIVQACFCFWLAALAFPAAAQTYSCNSTSSPISFGSQTLSSAVGATSVGTIVDSCTGVTGTTTFTWCDSLGAGSNSASQSNRTMASGANKIPYELYSDPSFSVPFAYPGAAAFTQTVVNKATSTNVTVYAKIISAGSIPAGTYTDTYSLLANAKASGGPGTIATATVCAYNNINTNTNVLNFTISVTIQASCSVAATAMAFGTQGVLGAAVPATATLTVNCTPAGGSGSTPYWIAMSAGAGGSVATRKMTGTGGSVNYGLYRDVGHTLNWGLTQNVDAYSGSSNGITQSIPVYGLVPAQPATQVGTYNDTIVVTLNY